MDTRCLWGKNIQEQIFVANPKPEGFPVTPFGRHRLIASSPCFALQQTADAASVFSGKIVGVCPPGFRRQSAEGPLGRCGVPIVVTPSSELRADLLHQVGLRDLVKATVLSDRSQNSCESVLRDTQSGPNADAVSLRDTSNLVSEEADRFIPMGDFGLLLTEFEIHSQELFGDLVFDVQGFLLRAIDENHKVVSVAVVLQFARMFPVF